jgi:hypothetical protein
MIGWRGATPPQTVSQRVDDARATPEPSEST